MSVIKDTSYLTVRFNWFDTMLTYGTAMTAGSLTQDSVYKLNYAWEYGDIVKQISDPKSNVTYHYVPTNMDMISYENLGGRLCRLIVNAGSSSFTMTFSMLGVRDFPDEEWYMEMYMKKMKYMILLIVFTVLCGCSEKEDKDVLVFPETTWGMSVQETLDTYEITKEDTYNYMEGGRGTAFILEGYEVFGEISYRVQFNYLDFSDNGNYELCRVQVEYPESVNMQSVLEKMRETYGETVSEIVVYREYSPLGDDILTKVNYTDSEQIKVWAGRTVAEFIPENESESYELPWEFFQGGLTQDNWEEFIQNARMVYVIWVAKEDVNVLVFDAYNLGAYTAMKSQLEEQQ